MKATRKSRPVGELFKGFDTTLRHYAYDRPRAYIEVARRKLRDLPKTNFDLGCDFAETGKWSDAIFRFRLAIYLQPNFTQAYYNLGCCYMRVGKRAKAIACFRKTLSAKPNHSDALFMLSSLDESAVPPDKLPRRMPKDMVQGFFTALAPNFEAIEAVNQYQGPRIMFEALKPYLPAPDKLRVLDLGCGVGLSARPWKPVAAEITGVDFTPAMVTEATKMQVNKEPLFHQVLIEDLSALSENALAAGSADVVIVCNVVQFVGELSGLMKATAAALKPRGVFGITIEPHGSARGFGVNPDTSRFGHTPDYVKQVAAAVGLTHKRDGKVNLYPQLAAHLLVFAKEA